MENTDKPPSRYHKKLGLNEHFTDTYDINDAYGVTCTARAHAVKKLLLPGQRGTKTVLDDLREARQSVDRAIELEERRSSC